jgi:hypothetical protein
MRCSVLLALVLAGCRCDGAAAGADASARAGASAPSAAPPASASAAPLPSARRTTKPEI